MASYDPTTALIVVDVQNDFADPNGSLSVPGGEEVVARANAEIIAAVTAGAPVFYTQDWHPPVTPHFQTKGGVWPVHCVMGTWGADLHPRLVVAGPSVKKGSNGEDGYSGFSLRDPETGEEAPTPLQGMLAERGVERTVVVGLALDYCVKATALDAAGHGHQTIVPLAGTAAVNLEPGDDERTIEELRAAGVEVAG